MKKHRENISRILPTTTVSLNRSSVFPVGSCLWDHRRLPIPRGQWVPPRAALLAEGGGPSGSAKVSNFFLLKKSLRLLRNILKNHWEIYLLTYQYSKKKIPRGSSLLSLEISRNSKVQRIQGSKRTRAPYFFYFKKEKFVHYNYLIIAKLVDLIGDKQRVQNKVRNLIKLHTKHVEVKKRFQINVSKNSIFLCWISYLLIEQIYHFIQMTNFFLCKSKLLSPLAYLHRGPIRPSRIPTSLTGSRGLMVPTGGSLGAQSPKEDPGREGPEKEFRKQENPKEQQTLPLKLPSKEGPPSGISPYADSSSSGTIGIREKKKKLEIQNNENFWFFKCQDFLMLKWYQKQISAWFSLWDPKDQVLAKSKETFFNKTDNRISVLSHIWSFQRKVPLGMGTISCSQNETSNIHQKFMISKKVENKKLSKILSLRRWSSSHPGAYGQKDRWCKRGSLTLNKGLKQRYLRVIKNILQKSKITTQAELIHKLNEIIGSWDSFVVNSITKSNSIKLNFILYQLLWQWGLARHRKQKAEWIKKRYWYLRQWSFESGS